MNDFAHTMKIVQANEALLCHLTNDWEWCTFIVIPLNDFEQIDSQNFKNGDEMLAMWSMM
jgi:hypothetical protein